MPSFTRSGFPVLRDFSSLARRSASRMISAAPFFRYVSCSSTGLKADMGKDIIRNAAENRGADADRIGEIEIPTSRAKARGKCDTLMKTEIRKATMADVPRLRE